ncbi:jg3306 [Pararge aegeria aegeria]|uniref:Jg3306 protein n=1 Tax=Pararge aegeria aegeria TaxID=348720 RepID=A0A8S4RUZ0_9NEOP|nr:jg3306 [Pararge aegeria aegeria]
MLRSNSLEKINTKEDSDATDTTIIQSNSGSEKVKRRSKRNCKSILERYHITFKPKLHKSNSLSDLSLVSSDIFIKLKIILYYETVHEYQKITITALDFLRRTENYLCKSELKNTLYDISGDTLERYWSRHLITAPYMSWNLKGKKSKKKCPPPDTYLSKFANDFVQNYQHVSSCAENSSTCSAEELNAHKMAAFPFKATPSGNLKVQSNQVVFQSSTVGVLLADPTQAKVKVKFEGKAAGEPDDDENNENSNDPELQLRYGPRETNMNSQNKEASAIGRNTKTKPYCSNDDKGEYLSNLGYALADPVDWMRVQLPKKQDLFQEFYRRIHNFINTDTIVHIGREEFHCHHFVLEIYSTFFEINIQREIELSCTNVTPEAFHTIYEWMIFSGPESNKILKRDNVLNLLCAAQYLGIKDLEPQCWSFIVNENLFNEDTAFALYREARNKEMTPVMDVMIPRVMRFFLPLVASKDFLELEPEEVITFLKSNYICVTSEIEVLMAGVRWLYGDWANRSRLAVEIMRCVRFGLISPWQLVDIKRNPENAEILEIVNEPEIQQMVDDGLAYVIIKYWYGNNSKNYYHWLDVLGLIEPAERNWIGEEKAVCEASMTK